jgi:nitroreductase
VISLEFEEVIKSRRTIRKFKEEDVAEEDIRNLIEAGILAPSAGNTQPTEYIIIRDMATKHSISQEALGQTHIMEAPVLIAVCANISRSEKRYGSRGRELYCIQDSAAAIENILLTAESLGLGAAWIGAFKERPVKDVLKIPDDVRLLAIIPVGHPAEIPDVPKRRSFKEIVHNEKW